MPLQAPNRGRGFGLLEAIVALALLAGTGLALFAWINQNLQAASRVAVVEAESRLTLTALSVVNAMDPMRQPTGRVELGAITVNWRARELETPRRNRGFGAAAEGAWLIGLYRVEVEAREQASGTQVRFDVTRVGTRRLDDAGERERS